MNLTDPRLLAVLLALPFVAIAAWFGWRRWRIVTARRAQRRTLLAVAHDFLADVLVPDGADGTLHVDFVLLTVGGLLVVDFRDVQGVIFGSEHMNDWTVMNGVERSTFPNPLGPLFDRVAAVKLAAGDSPVEGRIVFSERGQFPKGRPPKVVLLPELQSEFPAADREAGPAVVERWQAAWDRLKAHCTPSSLGRL